jgi:hypothetical protein
MSKADWDNHANQLNPNNDAYWQSRGYDERPEDESCQQHAQYYPTPSWPTPANPCPLNEWQDDWEPQWMPKDE